MPNLVARWLDHDFQVCDPRGRWLARPGLYLFASLETDRQGVRRWRALYVGKTQDFSDRLPTHEDWPEAVQLGATHIHALVLNKAAERARLECLIWDKYRPAMNEIAPPGCRELLKRLRIARDAKSPRS